MAISKDRARLVRAGLLNLGTNQLIRFFMNPTELSSQISVNWSKQQALGASYQRMHYRGTNNMTFNLELHFNRILFVEHHRTGPSPQFGKPLGEGLTRSELRRIAKKFEGYRKFLLGLCYPRGNVRDVIRRSPPHALLLWPKTVAIRVVMTSLGTRDTQFANDGTPTSFVASCAFEEFRTYRLTSGEVEAIGMVRRAGRGGEGGK
jgi:hypothetical protein